MNPRHQSDTEQVGSSSHDPARAAIGSWRISERSRIGFRIRGATRTVEGSFGYFGGRILNRPRTEPSVSGWVEVASIVTGNKERDAHLRSAEFFDVANHPRITLTLGKLLADGKSLVVSGVLTIKGVSRDVSLTGYVLPADRGEPGAIRMALEARVDRHAYGVRAPPGIEMFGLLIGRYVQIKLQILAEAEEDPNREAKREIAALLHASAPS